MSIFSRLFGKKPGHLGQTQDAPGAAASSLPLPPEFREDIRTARKSVKRFLRFGDASALDAASSAWERVLNHPAFPGTEARFQLAASNHAGRVLLRRYRAQGRVQDLDRALELWRQAVKLTPPDSPKLPGYLNNLGTGLSGRYERAGRLEDLEEAIGVYRRAVKLTPADSPDLRIYLNNLDARLRNRSAHMAKPADRPSSSAFHDTEEPMIE